MVGGDCFECLLHSFGPLGDLGGEQAKYFRWRLSLADLRKASSVHRVYVVKGGG